MENANKYIFVQLILVLEQFSATNEYIVYCILGFSAFLENIIPPIPGDSIIVFGAFLAYRSNLSFGLLLFSITFGCFVGLLVLYWVGYFFRKKIISGKWKFISPKKLETTKLKFARYGYWIILINRFLPGIRSITLLTAGLMNLKPKIIIPLAFLSALSWNGFILYLVYNTGQNWESIVNLFKQYNNIFFTVLIIIIVLIAGLKIYQKKWKKT